MRYILTPTLLITLTIGFAPLAQGEQQAEGVNFVTVSENSRDGFCYTDVHPLDPKMQFSDAKEEVQAGIEFIANTDGATFRGISREDVAVDKRGLSPCQIYGP